MCFAVTQSGITNCQQLKLASRTSLEVSKSAVEKPFDIIPSHSHSSLSKHDLDKTVSIIYSAFVSALILSATHALIGKGDWLEFGYDSCLRLSDEEDHLTGKLAMTDAASFEDSRDSVKQLHLDVRWSASGTLTVFGRTIPIAGLSRLAHALKEDDRGSEDIVSLSDPVFLAPFAAPYEFVGFEDGPSPALRINRQEKAITLAWLAARGCQLREDPAWVCVRPHDEVVQYENLSDSVEDIRLWWPAELCFFTPRTSQPDQPSILQKISCGTFVDPLAKAEQWFLGRAAREEAAEANRKATEEKELREKQLSELGVEQQLDDEAAIDRITQTGQYLSAQEASGIYPTPPDGLTSNAHSFFVAQDSTGTGTVEAHPSPMGAGEAPEVQMSSNESPALNLPGTHSGKRGSQDLFGDMDTDMFDTNGLTEADFNFFDDLDDRDDVRDDLVPPVTVDSGACDEGEGPATHGSLPARTGPDESPGDNISDGNGSSHENSKRARIVTSHTSLVTLIVLISRGFFAVYDQPSTAGRFPVELHDDQTLGLKLDSPSLKQEEDHDFNRSINDYVEEVDHERKRSPFDLVTTGGGSHNFDAKYCHDGRYAASPSEAPNGSRPGRIQDTAKQELPRIGLLPERSENSSDETEDMGHDDDGTFGCIW